MRVSKECRCCGRVMDFGPEDSVLACIACGTQNQAPRVEGHVLSSFRYAIRLQRDMEFERARGSYDLVLNFDPDNAEALWGRLLCQYGAAPVSENGRNYYMIHRPDEPVPLREHPDYVYACQLAKPEFREQMEAEAEYIDNAIHRIRALAETKQDFDVFLCHKCSHPEGGYTEDYKRANNLYMRLKEKGYRVFFAPFEMERQAAGEDYEAMIYHALKTSRVMLVICSEREYLYSKWVQGEWWRYLRMMAEDPAKKLIPLLYGGLPPEKLPKPFRYRKLQAINMEGDGYSMVEQNLQRILGDKNPPQPQANAIKPGAPQGSAAETRVIPAQGAVSPLPTVQTNPNAASGAVQGEKTAQQKPKRKSLGWVLAILTVLAALAAGVYFLRQPGAACEHARSSWKQTDISYRNRDGAYHTVREEKALICDDCGSVLQRTTSPATLEAHTFSGNVCERCSAQSEPAATPCAHTQTYSSPGSWQYSRYNDAQHEKSRTVDWYCSSCSAWVRQSSESTREAHSYSGSTCRYCGAAATPTPSPTPCAHTQTYSSPGSWQYSRYNDAQHEKSRTVDWYCSSCSAWVRQSSESTREAHSYSGSTCRYCGAAATPKPTQKTSFNTTLRTPFRMTLSKRNTVAVYSGPGTNYYRANGNAECSVHVEFYVFGYDNGWYMIRYGRNNGGTRVGYIKKTGEIWIDSASTLSYAYRSAVTNRSVSLTDDPDGNQGEIFRLSSGTNVTYLATYGSWYYIECSVNGYKTRGFIPSGSLDAR